MKYIADTFGFIFRNILYLLLFTAVPAAILAFSYSFDGYIMSIASVFTGKIASDNISFGEVFLSLSLMINENWFLVIIGLILSAISFSLVCSFSDRKMRIGTISIGKTFLSLNESLLATLPCLIALIIVFECMTLLYSAVVWLFLLLPVDVSVISIPIVSVFFVGVLIAVLTCFIGWCPIRLITGYGIFDSLGISVHYVENRFFRFFFGILIPCAAAILLNVCAGYFNPVLAFVVRTICNSFLLSFFGVYIMVVYFDVTGRTRADVKKSAYFGL